jgi:hypothetical protein
MDVDKILKKIKNRIHEKYIYDKQCFPNIVSEQCIINDFNRKFQLPKSSEFYEKFEKFCDQIFEHQCNCSVHPLTCGVDSSHLDLVPRITTKGALVLVCPTCGYVQDTLWFIDEKA